MVSASCACAEWRELLTGGGAAVSGALINLQVQNVGVKQV